MLRIIKTNYGLVRGIPAADPRITSFKGIPFAAPPIGDLRWKTPMPSPEWTGIKDCIEFAPISMQNIPGENPDEFYSKEWNVDPAIPMDEDCLYLNIWTPAVCESENLPVYVWFFGGGLQYGNTAEMEFDGERIARRGIIVVTVNYRINVFGFMAHPELTKENPTAPTNFGNLDQQFGLRWTYENIIFFGGNPENITIGGQSAGGGSVLTQLNCPKNKKYIKKAVIESGMFLNPYEDSPYVTLEEAEKQGEAFFSFLGIKNLEDARSLPAEYIRDKNAEGGFFWWTSTDGVFQKDYYLKNFYSGNILEVPLLLGYTSNEFYQNPDVSNLEELRELSVKRFGKYCDEFLSLLESSTRCFQEVLHKGSVNTIKLAILAALERKELLRMNMPSYLYEFSPYIPGDDNAGAYHSSDLWFYFETLAKSSRPFIGMHYDLARNMCNYLSNFIRNGNPNGFDNHNMMVKWEPYTLRKPVYMSFGNKIELLNSNKNDIESFLINRFGTDENLN